MKNFKEIIILGYGDERGLTVDEDGFISSKDIYNVGKEYGNNTTINRLLERKSVLKNILTDYIIGIDEEEFFIEGKIAEDYIKLLAEHNLTKDVESKEKIILTNRYIDNVLKEYDAGNNRYSGSRLLDTLPGFVRKYNYGRGVGQVVFYNKTVSMILASEYDSRLQHKIYAFL